MKRSDFHICLAALCLVSFAVGSTIFYSAESADAQIIQTKANTGAKLLQKSPAGIDCTACHDSASLLGQSDAALIPPAENIKRAHGGLRLDGATNGFKLIWPHRGTHSASDVFDPPKSCRSCHLISSEWIAHLPAMYPHETEDGMPGADCANACHTWLPSDQQTLIYDVHKRQYRILNYPGQPAAMLKGIESAHTNVWLNGYSWPGEIRSPIKLARIVPGCQGCHNMGSSEHGAITTCTDCHQFLNSKSAVNLHRRHLEVLSEGIKKPFPSLKSRSDARCGFCHDFKEAPNDCKVNAAAACYNCHLSGHAPKILNFKAVAK